MVDLKEYQYTIGQNLAKLRMNNYPGRGIIIGLDDTGKNLVQVYFVMGRSDHSRNRVLSARNGVVFTEAADPAKIKDPSLIIYNAMCEVGETFVVSNGSQTDAIINAIAEGEDFRDGLAKYTYEPDPPNNTARISAICSLGNHPIAEMAVLRKSQLNDGCDRCFYSFEELSSGVGFCITTYLHNGDPPPAFCGEPVHVPLRGDIKTVLHTYWDVLDEVNRVSLAVKFVHVAAPQKSVTLIINKFKKI